ncbi:receptor-like protein 7 [Gossypium hirsutum]|uniref:Receptor-like protein 7 n=1 Tax=Gossypium hirsutum TaxID=3635 RepID=A0ABM3AEZ5_GOSHI|nr:receptor-like protein 7 [Gossypium hirsutum]
MESNHGLLFLGGCKLRCWWSCFDFDLSGREISSPIDDSSSLFHLQHLRQLNLALNQFMTAFPTIFDKLENLRYLNLSEAGFTGQIPIGISRLTRLVTLDLSIHTLFRTPLKLEKPNLKTLVQNLMKLRFLYLDGVNISATGNEWCQALSPLTELQVLSMSDCYLSGPIHSSLSRLRPLSVIRLDRNNLSSLIPQFCTKFPNLTCLSLSSVNFSGPIPSFSSSINLRELILALNQLNGTIHSTDWTGFSKLEIIGLGNNKLSGTISPTLLGISSLQTLSLSITNSMAALVTFMVRPLH